MSKDYQSLNRFIKDGVKQIRTPFKLDDDLLDICQDTYDNDSKHLNPRELSRILKEEILDNEEFLQFFKDLELPINLQSDYKLYSLGDLIEQILTLPEIDTSSSKKISNLNKLKYDEYNNKRIQLITKIQKLQQLKEETQLLKNYNELLNIKLNGGDGINSNIRQNTLHKNNTELSNEITKLKINLQRFQTFDKNKKEKFQKILKNEYP
ncbi:hypothetical protein BN7_2202 [Wickerhamomyces ciferrii]|uniref:Uncharacterized protein n=1 Tax=Wickerhamomyces ciferrii (strain ATCC 14091 / BCRC 22168 / CBS 111 / JCM 3599 / NBRC 0793 / NRRL Y-1031 F-60-10) TaxID=1206466 RepID=K0KNF5_WICCF|nr:uncharacterized protein BN7_2202 [Wickerhamomyces ciferrii]CCH42658.1 hypothetical protein BN7_2202 [Wickerhamomyces ciferrii]